MLPEDPAEERRAWQGRLLEDRPGLLQELGLQRGGQAGYQASGGEEAEQEEHQDPDQFHVWGLRGGGGGAGQAAPSPPVSPHANLRHRHGERD